MKSTYCTRASRKHQCKQEKNINRLEYTYVHMYVLTSKQYSAETTFLELKRNWILPVWILRRITREKFHVSRNFAPNFRRVASATCVLSTSQKIQDVWTSGPKTYFRQVKNSDILRVSLNAFPVCCSRNVTFCCRSVFLNLYETVAR
jgi:hypothetical protein